LTIFQKVVQAAKRESKVSGETPEPEPEPEEMDLSFF
jgi:hypothetical protein